MLKIIGLSAAIALTVGAALAQSSPTTTPVSPTNSGMAQPAGSENKPKIYQPANPAPDTRSAPTTTSVGSGSDNGGRPEQQPKK